MLNLTGGEWPLAWKPRGWNLTNHDDQESFADWWERWAHKFPHLDPRVLEQWVHRHWINSDYFGLPLENAKCEIEHLATTMFVSEIGWSGHQSEEPLDLNYIYKTFNGFLGPDREPTKTMNLTGTWDMPILLVRRTSGFVYCDTELPNFSLWLIEGHQRFRYLRALAGRGLAADHHDALVLTLAD